MNTNRTTLAHVAAKVQRVNDALGIQNPAYNVPGTVELNRAYGGTQVVQVCNDSHGVRTLSRDGFGTLRQAATFLDGMLASLDITQGQA